jgi:hypothetical protein
VIKLLFKCQEPLPLNATLPKNSLLLKSRFVLETLEVNVVVPKNNVEKVLLTV